jgi:hypothetical protein
MNSIGLRRIIGVARHRLGFLIAHTSAAHAFSDFNAWRQVHNAVLQLIVAFFLFANGLSVYWAHVTGNSESPVSG